MASDMMIHCGGGEGNRGMNGFLLLDDFLAAAKAYWGRVGRGRVGWSEGPWELSISLGSWPSRALSCHS